MSRKYQHNNIYAWDRQLLKTVLLEKTSKQTNKTHSLLSTTLIRESHKVTRPTLSWCQGLSDYSGDNFQLQVNSLSHSLSVLNVSGMKKINSRSTFGNSLSTGCATAVLCTALSLKLGDAHTGLSSAVLQDEPATLTRAATTTAASWANLHLCLENSTTDRMARITPWTSALSPC